MGSSRGRLIITALAGEELRRQINITWHIIIKKVHILRGEKRKDAYFSPKGNSIKINLPFSLGIICFFFVFLPLTGDFGDDFASLTLTSVIILSVRLSQTYLDPEH